MVPPPNDFEPVDDTEPEEEEAQAPLQRVATPKTLDAGTGPKPLLIVGAIIAAVAIVLGIFYGAYLARKAHNAAVASTSATAQPAALSNGGSFRVPTAPTATPFVGTPRCAPGQQLSYPNGFMAGPVCSGTPRVASSSTRALACPPGTTLVTATTATGPVQQCVAARSTPPQTGTATTTYSQPAPTATPLPDDAMHLAPPPEALSAEEVQAQNDVSARRGQGGAAGGAQSSYPQPQGYTQPGGVQSQYGQPAYGQAQGEQEPAAGAVGATQTGQFTQGGAHADFANANEQGQPGYVQPLTRCQLNPTTFIAARALTRTGSDIPGPGVYQTEGDVYSSTDKSCIAIPNGTKLQIAYDTKVNIGEGRLFVGVQVADMPDGREFRFTGLSAGDALGEAGVPGEVNNHRGNLYGAGAILTVISAAEAAAAASNQASNGLYSTPSIGQQMQGAAGATLLNIVNGVVQQQLGRPETVQIQPKQLVIIQVTRDLPLEPYAVQP